MSKAQPRMQIVSTVALLRVQWSEAVNGGATAPGTVEAAMTCFPSPPAVNATSLRALRVRRQGGCAGRRLGPGGRAIHNPAHVPIIILAAHRPPARRLT